MLTIGEFSKVCGISVKALRYYDEINLIKPAEIDDKNGYRYYYVTQLASMSFINKLKRYGFSLQQIKELIDSEDVENVHLALIKQKQILLNKISEEENRLYELNIHLENYERTGDMMSYQNEYVAVKKEIDSIAIVSVRKVMSVSDFDEAFKELFIEVGKLGASVCGNGMAIYHDKEFDPEHSDIEVAVQILEQDKATRMLQGGTCIQVVHKGSYENLPEAYAFITQYIDEHGYKVNIAPYEVYRESGMNGKQIHDWETDVIFLIEN